jgi:hypothetical protein
MDLGLTLIGIDQLLGADQTDHHEVFLLLIEHLQTVLLPELVASNGPPVLYLQFLEMMHLRLKEILLLSNQVLKACLTHPFET